MEVEERGLSDVAIKAQQIEDLMADSVKQARDLARSLTPVPPHEAALAAALQELAASASRRFGIACEFECEGEDTISSNERATHLYRIAQEAIDNAAVHGKAHRIDLRLSANPSALTLSVTDNGTGIPECSQNGNGTGIEIMRCRANLLGGDLEIERAPCGGTIVSCTVGTE
jgi:signal transduction histidine kinase